MIKKVSPKDINMVKEVALLMMSTFPQAYENQEEVELEVTSLSISPNHLFVYLKNEKVIGCIGTIMQYGTTGYELHPLIIHQNYRNQNIGSKLLHTLEAEVIKNGGIMMYLGSDDEFGLTSLSDTDLFEFTFDKIENITSEAHPFLFYQKHGYQITGVIPDANGFGKPDIIMTKRLVNHHYESKDSLKRRYPIIEVDPIKEALINPEFITRKYPRIHSKLVITFFKDVILKLLQEQKIELHFTLRGENTLDVYQYKDLNITIIEGKLGAPACAGFLEEMIALGAKDIMFCGGGGAIQKDLTFGKFVVVTDAIRDEGLSYHYYEPSRTIKANPNVYNHIALELTKRNIPYILGRVWTTDAFFRETKKIIEIRKNEEALIVEMEQAGMLAVSNYRGVSYGAIIYAGDDVSSDVWDSRNWHTREDIRYHLVELCRDIVLSLNS
jgi:uridine phosphorylase